MAFANIKISIFSRESKACKSVLSFPEKCYLLYEFYDVLYVILSAIDNNVLQFYFINNIVFLHKKCEVCYLFI